MWHGVWITCLDLSIIISFADSKGIQLYSSCGVLCSRLIYTSCSELFGGLNSIGFQPLQAI